MIIKASQRKGGRALGKHLMNTNDNDHVEIGESRGFWGKSIYDCFLEIEAIASGTKCEQPLFSVSFNPPEGKNVTNAQFYNAFDRLEELLGLKGQPRFPVFHEKNGRRHAHCVWSRIDIDKMKAVNMAFFKEKCTQLSKELFFENNWALPKGLLKKTAKDTFNISVGEFQRLIKRDVHPNCIRESCKAAWNSSIDRRSLEQRLREYDLFLAKGDKRGAVIVDANQNVYSLSRYLGLSVKKVKDRIGDTDSLPSVRGVNSSIRSAFNREVRSKITALSNAHYFERQPMQEEKLGLINQQRKERQELEQLQQANLRNKQTKAKKRYRSGLSGIFDKVTGREKRVREINRRELEQMKLRQDKKRQTLIFNHLIEQEKIYNFLSEIDISQKVERISLARQIHEVRRLRKLKHE